jgi:heme O synthase-like polyprenyltransferase
MPKLSLGFIAFLQALGLLLYCSLIGWFFFRANSFFGPVNTFLGPTVLLLIFIISAVICALIFLGYPFILFWEKKQTRSALHLVVCSSLWLALLIVLILLIFLIH